MKAVPPLRDFLVLVDVRYKPGVTIWDGDRDMRGYKVSAASEEDISEALRVMILESLEGDDLWVGASIVSIINFTTAEQGQVFENQGLGCEDLDPKWRVERYQNHRHNPDGSTDIEHLDFVLPGPRSL